MCAPPALITCGCARHPGARHAVGLLLGDDGRQVAIEGAEAAGLFILSLEPEAFLKESA